MKKITFIFLIFIILLLPNINQGNEKVEKTLLVTGLVKYSKMMDENGRILDEKKVNTKVVVKFINDSGKEYLTETNLRGEYKIKLPVGKYEAIALIPSGFSIQDTSAKISFELKRNQKVSFELISGTCG